MNNYEDQRAERDFRMNPPKSAPGTGSDDEWGELFQEGSSSVEDPSLGLGNTGSDLDSMLNGGYGSSPYGTSYGDYNQNQESLTSTEDKFFKGAEVVGKGLFSYIINIVRFLRNNKEGDWHRLGERVVKISVASFGLGGFFLLLSPFWKAIQNPYDLMIGSALAGAVGVILLMFNNSDKTLGNTQSYQEPIEEEDFDLSGLEDNDIEYEEEEEEIDLNDVEIDDDIFDSIISSNENDLFSSMNQEGVIGSEGFNIEEQISLLKEVPEGLYTRQYLYETFSSLLPNITPNFNDMETLSEGSDEFMMFETALRSAAEQVGTKEEKIPELLEVRKGLFIIQLRAERPAGLKEQEIADEVANMYMRDDYGTIIKHNVYATVDSFSNNFIINIFTGNQAMVSVKDVYKFVGEDIKNTGVKMPFVWGVNELGHPIYSDMINCYSILVCGEPRKGKSWLGQSLLAQLCMYNSPRDIEFYIFDGKGTSSDYHYPAQVLPQIRYFCGEERKVIEGMKRVIDKVKSEVDPLLNEADVLEIHEYNKKNPTNKIPFRYILIDEMQSLMSTLESIDKELWNEFKTLLSTIVSKMPYTGLRFIGFPHRIVDSVIPKNTYSLVSTRACVGAGMADDIKNALGVSKRDFPYNISQVGDMGIKTKEVANGSVVYCHAGVLTKSAPDNRDLFRFIGMVWNKLEPKYKNTGMKVHEKMGGEIYIASRENVNTPKVVKPTKDNTVGKEDYVYQGINDFIEEEGYVDDGLKDDVDESFWDQFTE